MRLRRKLFIKILTFFILLFYYWVWSKYGNAYNLKHFLETTQRQGDQQSKKEELHVSQPKHQPINQSKYHPGDEIPVLAGQCESSANNVRLTADITTSQILDNVYITKQTYLQGDLKDKITEFKHNTDGSEDYKKVPIEIIVMPHSHNDPGWLKTYMTYFRESTTHILTNIVRKLEQYSDMKFVWVESCFMDVWWKEQTDAVRRSFKALVQSGRIEIVSGMWVAPDEASTHYFALIDQMIEGHYWVKTNLGIVPESSMNFDQFGYSATMPYLVKKAGIKNVLIKRIYRPMKDAMGKHHWMTYYWQQFWDPVGLDAIFSHVEPYEWMSISDSCGPNRGICNELDFLTRPNLPDTQTDGAGKTVGANKYSNLHELVKNVVGQMKQKANNYEQRVMLLPHGGDFRYATIDEWDKQYRNMKLFMNYVNERVDEFNVHMKFGTLKDYYSVLEEHSHNFKLSFPVVSGDFYPYTETNSYWTGYFTTRMFDKRLSREVQESIRAAELFTHIAFHQEIGLTDDIKHTLIELLVEARQDLGLFMHHDAITGTSKAHVVVDYEKRLSAAFISAQHAFATSVSYLLFHKQVAMKATVKSILSRQSYDTLTEVEPVPAIAQGSQLVFVNSLTQSRTEIISLPIRSSSVSVTDHEGMVVECDILQIDGKIEFPVRIPPVGVVTYTIKDNKDHGNTNIKYVKPLTDTGKQYVCENSLINITFDLVIGSTEKICYKDANMCEDIKTLWSYYPSMSGAYMMLSNGHKESATKSKPSIDVFNGRYICRVVVKYDILEVEYAVSKGGNEIEMALKINVKTNIPKTYNGDLAMEFQTGIDNTDFYTDSNGFQMLQRKYRQKMPFGGNIYPMTSMAFIESRETRLILHSAQPHGIVSSSAGLLTIFVDRAVPGREAGLPEGVSDTKPTKTTFLLQLESTLGYDRPKIVDTLLPSINTVFLNDLLQNPVFGLIGSSEIFPLSPATTSFLRQPIPCDVILANVKNLADIDHTLNGTSIAFARRGITCGKSLHKELCPLFYPMNIQPGELLGQKGWKGHVSTEMYLSHLMVKKSLLKSDSVNIQPFDIRSFHLRTLP